MMSPRMALIGLMLATLGIWGCAKSQSNSAAATSERIKALEARAVKLEDDFRTAAAVRDQLRRKLATSEEQQVKGRADLERQVQGLYRERDEVRQQLQLRTSERDSLASQYDAFRKTIREVLGQADAAISKPATEQPVTTVDAALPGES